MHGNALTRIDYIALEPTTFLSKNKNNKEKKKYLGKLFIYIMNEVWLGPPKLLVKFFAL